MSGQIRYSDEFKIDAVAQVTERGYSVKEVAERLWISTKSLYTWMTQFSKPQRQTDQEAEVRRLKKELARVTEERDILKKTVPGCCPPVRGINSLCYAAPEGKLPMAYWWAGPR